MTVSGGGGDDSGDICVRARTVYSALHTVIVAAAAESSPHRNGIIYEIPWPAPARPSVRSTGRVTRRGRHCTRNLILTRALRAVPSARNKCACATGSRSARHRDAIFQFRSRGPNCTEFCTGSGKTGGHRWPLGKPQTHLARSR